jgi:hypothetical protein
MSPTRTEIRLATNDADRQAVYASRYDIICREMGLDIPSADHQRRLVIDKEDATGHLLAAFKNGNVVGSGRVNFLRDGLVEPHSTLLGLKSAPEIEQLSISTRLLISTAHRGTRVMVRIWQAWFGLCRAASIERDFVLVKAALANLYFRLGYRSAGTETEHPEIGKVIPLEFHFFDEQHLREIRSPFVHCLDDRCEAFAWSAN